MAAQTAVKRPSVSVQGQDGTSNGREAPQSFGRLSIDTTELANNPFADPQVAAHYAMVYEKARYECRHVFDPALEWTKQEEKRIVRKLDCRVCLWACVMFFALQVDRGNIAQAVSGKMLKQLKLSTNDYNYGNTIFVVAFLLAELPSQLISKRIGSDRWIPIQMTLWSIVAASQAALTGKSSFYATRALLGLLEGGFIPDIVLWLSYFYTSRELPIRLSIFWTTSNATGIVTSLLAFALFHLDGIQNLAGWRWLFLIEGLLTLVIGLASFFMMPPSPVQTKTWFRPKGWFTDREVAVVVNRVLRDDPSKGDMHNRKAVSPHELWTTIKDYDLWPIYIIGLLAYIPQTPPRLYLTLILRELGFSTFNTNLLTIPNIAIGIFMLLGLTAMSELLSERALISMLQAVWTLPCLLALRFWGGALENAWGTYALITVLLSYPYCHAIVVAWASKNSGSVRTRTVSTAVYNIFVQLDFVIAANIYRADDAPLYHRGNSNLIIINFLVMVAFIGAKFYYMWRNKTRAKKWASMSAEERSVYLNTTRDQGNKRLDFRFAH